MPFPAALTHDSSAFSPVTGLYEIPVEHPDNLGFFTKVKLRELRITVRTKLLGLPEGTDVYVKFLLSVFHNCIEINWMEILALFTHPEM